jgi:hypothetical protein
MKKERLDHANKVICAISSHGRRFFYHEGRTASLEMDIGGKIWLLDEYSQKRVNTHKRGGWLEFSHGGTLRNIIETLRDYIMAGDPLPGAWIGPSCGYGAGDVWGYGHEALAAVRAALADNPAVAFDRAAA